MKVKYKSKFSPCEYIARKLYEDSYYGKLSLAVVDFDDARVITREILKHNDVEIGMISLSQPEINGYDKLYYIGIVEVGEDLELYVEEGYHEANEYHDAGYYHIDDSKIYITNDSSGVLSVINQNLLFSDVNCDAVKCVCVDEIF